MNADSLGRGCHLGARRPFEGTPVQTVAQSVQNKALTKPGHNVTRVTNLPAALAGMQRL